MPNNRALLSKLGKLAYAAVLISIIVLAVTGIGTFATGKAPMTQWVLMLHVAVAPLFALGLALLSLTWAGHYRFDGSASPQKGLAKAFFWLTLLSGLAVILSGILPMTPIFGTDGQHQLYLVHRYSGIVLTASFLLLSLCPRRRK